MLLKFVVLFFIVINLHAKINFSTEEKEWIKNNPVIKVGGETDWAPFDFVDKNGKHNGITKDYLDLISQKSGLKFDVLTGYTWNQLIENFTDKQFDLLPAIYYSTNRKKIGNFTTAYYTVRDYLFVREESSINSFDDLKGKTLAIPKGYTIVEKINKQFPQIKILETRSIVDSIASVLSHQADATLEVHAVMSYTLKTNAIDGIKVVAQETFGVHPLHMLVQKENAILHSILNKSIISINQDEQKDITQRWLINTQKDNFLNNTQVLYVLIIFATILILFIYRQYILKNVNKKLEIDKKTIER